MVEAFEALSVIYHNLSILKESIGLHTHFWKLKRFLKQKCRKFHSVQKKHWGR